MSYRRLDIRDYSDKVLSINSALEKMSISFDETIKQRVKYQSLVAAYIDKSTRLKSSSVDSKFIPVITSDNGTVLGNTIAPAFISTIVNFTTTSQLISNTLQDSNNLSALRIKGSINLIPDSAISAIRIVSVGESILEGVFSDQGRLAPEQKVEGDTLVWVPTGIYTNVNLVFRNAFIHTIQMISASWSNISPTFDIRIPLVGIESFRVLGRHYQYDAQGSVPPVGAQVRAERNIIRDLKVTNREDGSYFSSFASVNPLSLKDSNRPIYTSQSSVLLRLSMPAVNGYVLSDIEVDFNPR